MYLKVEKNQLFKKLLREEPVAVLPGVTQSRKD